MVNRAKPSVLLVSRPIAPPWDEASKNFALNLAQKLRSWRVGILVNEQIPEVLRSVEQVPIYSKPTLDWVQRARLLFLRHAQKQFDIVHYLFTPTRLNSFMFRVIIPARASRRIQTVATIRDIDAKSSNLRKLLFADQIVTYSEYSKRKLEALGLSHVTCIYPGIRLDKFKPSVPDRKLAQGLGIQPSDFVVMYPGEYVRLGATDMLVASIPELLKHIPNLKFVFACRIKNTADTHKKQQVLDQLASQGLTNHVVFTDTIEDMPALYNLADIIVFPVGNMEGKFDVPLAVIEAMACAKPVIVSDLPVLAEFTSAENALIVSANDRVQFTEKVGILAENHELRGTLGQKARQYAATHYDIRKIAKRYGELYEAVRD